MKYLFGTLIYFLLSSSGYSQNYMTIHNFTNPPIGFVEFCEKGNSLCDSHGSVVRVTSSIENLIELDEVNQFVNSKIYPISDMDNYGKDEVWTIPTNKGDCEDYALLKQKILLARGWPSSSLLLTVVTDEKNEYHTILAARTEIGDYILDNKIKEIMLWNEFPYHYIMRQSTVDPKLWYTLEENK